MVLVVVTQGDVPAGSGGAKGGAGNAAPIDDETHGGPEAEPGGAAPLDAEAPGGREAESGEAAPLDVGPAGVRWAIPARARRARAVRVVDGDTLELAGLGSSRLIGIDTPEVHGGRECFGTAASAYVERLVPAGTPIRYALGRDPRDRYGRALVTVWLRDGRSLNALLVRRGYASTLTIAPNTLYAGRLAALERRARSERRGLWGSCGRD